MLYIYISDDRDQLPLSRYYLRNLSRHAIRISPAIHKNSREAVGNVSECCTNCGISCRFDRVQRCLR